MSVRVSLWVVLRGQVSIANRTNPSLRDDAMAAIDDSNGLSVFASVYVNATDQVSTVSVEPTDLHDAQFTTGETSEKPSRLADDVSVQQHVSVSGELEYNWPDHKVPPSRRTLWPRRLLVALSPFV